MNKRIQELEEIISDAKKVIQEAFREKAEIQDNCPHDTVEPTPWGTVKCKDCYISLGWHCLKNPYHSWCQYNSNKDPLHDSCIYCGLPEERK